MVEISPSAGSALARCSCPRKASTVRREILKWAAGSYGGPSNWASSHIDTANFYQNNDGSVQANVLIREALQPYKSDLVIATKVGPIFGPNGLQPAGASDLRRLIEENLDALGLQRLDLVYLRIGMMEVPHAESIAARFEALAALREEGLIRHLGLSNVDIGHLAEARAIAPVAAIQNNFHIANRDEVALLHVCTEERIAFVPFFPLGGGRTDFASDQLMKVATRRGATAAQIGLAWLLKLSPVTLAIPGTGSLTHLEENVAAGSVHLAAEDLAELS
ncbi:pyridoxine 4-dehydrogenase [Bradyrhizobium sp. i1.4.4]